MVACLIVRFGSEIIVPELLKLDSSNSISKDLSPVEPLVSQFTSLDSFFERLATKSISLDLGVSVACFRERVPLGLSPVLSVSPMLYIFIHEQNIKIKMKCFFIILPPFSRHNLNKEYCLFVSNII